MTKREFNKTIGNMYDIYDFCTTHPKYDYITDDIYCNEDMVDFLKDLLKDMHFENVQALLDFVDGISVSDWYYIQDGVIYALDFEELKDDLSGVLEYDGFFTDEEPISNEDTDDDIVANDINVLYAE